MNILLCHNYYACRGGEDQVFEAEASLLRSQGHKVFEYTRHNNDIARMSRSDVARRTLWNGTTYRELRDLIERHRPAVMHCTNTFPLISPSAYYAAHDAGVPVVQSLHNYRLFCANGLFLRHGKACEKCLGKRVTWPAVQHACYRDSRAGSAVVASLQAWHRFRHTWTEMVDRYVALSEFSRRKFVEGGLPADKITVKTNFVAPDPGPARGQGGYLVFVGRLSPEKGVDTLLQAWRHLRGKVPLKILGDGPLAPQVHDAVREIPNIEYLGQQPLDTVLAIVGEAQGLVLPTKCYENCPRTLLEAYARATPVIASRTGAMVELVEDGVTGFNFSTGDAFDLVDKVNRLTQDSTQREKMRQAARSVFEKRHTAKSNYRTLIDIYNSVVSPPMLAPAHGPHRAPTATEREPGGVIV